MELIILTLTLLLIIAIFFLYKKNKDLKDIIDLKTKAINVKFKGFEDLTLEHNKYVERVKELEGAIEDSYGIKIRNEVTEVIADFTKLEMVILISGVSLLLKRTDNPEDSQYYINLSNKINGFLEHMKEEEDSILKGSK